MGRQRLEDIYWSIYRQRRSRTAHFPKNKNATEANQVNARQRTCWHIYGNEEANILAVRGARMPMRPDRYCAQEPDICKDRKKLVN